MKTVKVLLSGVVFVFAAVAAPKDQFAEERYHMKYGRYTPAEEARRNAVAAEKKDAVKYIGQACCRHMPHDTQLAVKAFANEAWFRAKFGRSTPAYEAGKKAAELRIAAHVARCAELGRCPLTRVRKTEERSFTFAGTLSDGEARLQTKYGRRLSAQERGKVMPAAREARPFLAVAEHSPCTEACCTHGE